MLLLLELQLTLMSSVVSFGDIICVPMCIVQPYPKNPTKAIQVDQITWVPTSKVGACTFKTFSHCGDSDTVLLKNIFTQRIHFVASNYFLVTGIIMSKG